VFFADFPRCWGQSGVTGPFIRWAAYHARQRLEPKAMTDETTVSGLQHSGKIEEIFSADDQ
jgi:hypothetical protein